MSRAIIHVDMDAFFASVEQRQQPALKGRPVAVGGTPEGRGVVAAASYEARKFGVHSAMPMATAVRLCPDLIILPPNGALYSEVSQQIHAIFQRFTPQIEPLSLDEAFLDISASLALFGSAESIGKQIKSAILDELELVASVGIAGNKYLAKLASDMDKPDGFYVFNSATTQQVLDRLPVNRLWGVGSVTAKTLQKLGIQTIGQFRQYPLRLLQQHLGNAAAGLWQLAHGIDERAVISETEAKSISHETTFDTDIESRDTIRIWLLDLAEQVGWRLRRHGLRGRTIFIKLRYADFTTITRSKSLTTLTDVTARIKEVVQDLYRNKVPATHPPVRLLGVGISGFDSETPLQTALFEDEKEQKLDLLMDELQQRFGRHSVRRGRDPGQK